MSFWERSYQACASALGMPARHGHAQDRYFQTLNRCIRPGARWLDLGCGKKIVPEWAARPPEQKALAARSSYFVGADVDTPTLAANPYLQHRVAALGGNLPFAPGSFDLVSANMVVEHLETPAQIFTEVARVLSPGGTFLFHTPNRFYPYIALASLVPDGVKNRIIWTVERRAEEDVFKTHYRANSLGRIRDLAQLTGFSVSELSVGGSVGLFRIMGPLALLELPYLKLLTLGPFRDLNATIIGVLTKPQ